MGEPVADPMEVRSTFKQTNRRRRAGRHSWTCLSSLRMGGPSSGVDLCNSTARSVEARLLEQRRTLMLASTCEGPSR